MNIEYICKKHKKIDSSSCPAALRDASSAVTAPIGLPACDARPSTCGSVTGHGKAKRADRGHATARWRVGGGCGGGGAEARGAAAGWVYSAALGCIKWIGGGGACAVGVQGRRGGARQGGEWEGVQVEDLRQGGGRRSANESCSGTREICRMCGGEGALLDKRGVVFSLSQ